MSNELDSLVKQKVGERLKEIDQEKRDADSALRLFLAVAGAGAGWWLGSQFGAHGEQFYWLMGIGAVLGAVYELVGLAISLGFLVALVKCVS